MNASSSFGSVPVGTRVRYKVLFKSLANVAADPATVRFKIKPAGGAQVTYVYPTNAELVKDSVGNYHVDYLLSIPGFWTARFEGSGTVDVASDDVVVTAKPTALT